MDDLESPDQTMHVVLRGITWCVSASVYTMMDRPSIPQLHDITLVYDQYIDEFAT